MVAIASKGSTARDKAILEFEAQWWLLTDGRSKRQAIREELAISPATYYAILDGLLDSPEAARSHPLVVARLRKRRFERLRARFVPGAPARGSR